MKNDIDTKAMPERTRKLRTPGPRVGTSIGEFETAFPDDAACKAHLFRVRYGQLTSCPWCHLNTSWWHHPTSAAYVCTRCRHRLELKSQTVFHKTKLSLKTLFYAILFSANSSATPPNLALSRHLGISLTATLAFGRRLRAHMTAREADRRLGSPGATVHAEIFHFTKLYSISHKGKKRATLLVLSDGQASSVSVLGSTRPARIFEVMRHRVIRGTKITASDPVLLHKIEIYKQRWFEVLQWADRQGSEADDCKFESSVFLMTAVKAIRKTYRRISVEWLDQYLGEQAFRFNRRGQSIFLEIIAEFPQLDGSILRSRTEAVWGK